MTSAKREEHQEVVVQTAVKWPRPRTAPSGHSTLLLATAWYMLLASLGMGVADLLGKWRPRGGSAMGTIASSVLPLVAIVAAAL